MAKPLDWEQVKTAYVSGSESYQKLAERFSVSKTALCAHGRKEGWPAMRAAYRKSVADHVVKRKRAGDADKLIKLMEAADDLAQRVAWIAADKKQFNRRFAEIMQKDPETGQLEVVASEYITDKADTKALADMTRALSDLTRTMRNLYGLPTQQEKHQQRMEARRTRILESRSGTLEPEDTGVVFMPEAVAHPDEASVEVEQ